MRKNTQMNHNWKYITNFQEEYIDPSFDVSSWKEISLPHTTVELPVNGFDEQDYQIESTYRTDLFLSTNDVSTDKQVFLCFGGVMLTSKVYINGNLASTNVDGFTPFEVDITPHLTFDANNVIVVYVNAKEQPEIPPFGHVVDYLCFGGMYREVAFEVRNKVTLKDIFVYASTNFSEIHLEFFLSGSTKLDYHLEVSICSWLKKDHPLLKQRFTFDKWQHKNNNVFRLTIPWCSFIKRWDLENPNLYVFTLSLLDNTTLVDEVTIRTGFRDAKFTNNGFYLNGKPRFLMGLNRHQSYPHVGYAMPKNVERNDAIILKKDLGLDIVRTSHYPQSVHFLDVCDELGLLVFEELPGWQHIGNSDWKNIAKSSLEKMILRDRNHPSIVLWGVRINESADDDVFYQDTNQLATSLDPTRDTGGVRNFAGSNLLENVYTYNDFSFDGGKKIVASPKKITKKKSSVAYLVSEFNGHMFPTKRFDTQEWVNEHALRHAKVLNAARGNPNIHGAIGWCSFDYNTHKDFGSGDKICYHGVMDMFRIPKLAAYVYASQQSPDKKIVLEVGSHFAKGDRQAARILPILVWTNVDYITLSCNGEYIKTFYPNQKEYPHLLHPPIKIDDVIGNRIANQPIRKKHRALVCKLASKALEKGVEQFRLFDKLALGWIMIRNRLTIQQVASIITTYAIGWGEKSQVWEIKGFRKDIEVVSKTFDGNNAAVRLVMTSDCATLTHCETYDATRIHIQLVDSYNHPVPYIFDVIDIKIDGPATIIGPSSISLIHGEAAFWIKTTENAKTSSTITIQAITDRVATATLMIPIVK